MYTRILENHSYHHNGVEKISLKGKNKKSVIFNADCVYRHKGGQTSGPDMFAEEDRKKIVGEKTLRIDIERKDMFRIRFAESSEVPENDTPMVVGKFSGASYDFIENENEFVIDTGIYKLLITKEPYRLEIFDRNGIKKFRSSGGDDNHFKPLDAPNLGIVRGGDKPLDITFPHGTKHEYLPEDVDATIAVDSFKLDHNEHIYGFGENFIGLDKRYQTIDLWTQDALGSMSRRTYKPIPFYLSSKGYGIYVNSHAPMTFWLGTISNVRNILAVEEEFMDYYIILGENMKQVIAGYNDLTGNVPLPPKWSFGFWLSKYTYHSDAEASEVVEKMRNNKLPFDVLHLDVGWFDREWVCDLEFGKESFPDPVEFAERMNDKGVHLSLWLMPYIDERNKLFKEARDKGYFLEDREYLSKLKSEEKPSLQEEGFDNFQVLKWGTFDVSNPEFVEWFKEKLRHLFRMGYDVIKTDFGEGAPTIDAEYYNGIPARKMHNAYPLLYNTIVFDVAKEFYDRPIIWSRSTWAGCQRYPVHWGGDPTAIYDNLIPQLTGGLSLMLSGFYFWSHDMGSLSGKEDDKELYLRWLQQGLFTSHPRNHGGGKCEPFNLGPVDMDMARKMLNLRYRLIPYIYSSAYQSVENKVPFMRPMPLEFEEDHNVHTMDDQFMFGPYIMVAPIYKKGGEREVYFPKGRWYDFWTRERIEGGKWIKINMDVDKIPLYLRSGAIIPMGPLMQHVDEKAYDPISLLLVPGNKQSEFLYYDDNESFNIMLDENSLYIDQVDNHIFRIYVHTKEQINNVVVNGQDSSFKQENFGFSIEYKSSASQLDIKWI
ncbi:MAG: TIM-barrel domain-containing protein [Halothermotrichaceae bacterium]